MIPIDSLIQIAISFFEIQVDVRDCQYVKVNGEDQRQVIGARNILAAVDPSNSKNLERIFGGSLGDGDIGIYATDTLYLDDSYQEGAERKQSFILYQDHIYRVVNDANWQPQIGVNVYLAKRHFSQDNAENEFAAINNLFAWNNWQFAGL